MLAVCSNRDNFRILFERSHLCVNSSPAVSFASQPLTSLINWQLKLILFPRNLHSLSPRARPHCTWGRRHYVISAIHLEAHSLSSALTPTRPFLCARIHLCTSMEHRRPFFRPFTARFHPLSIGRSTAGMFARPFLLCVVGFCLFVWICGSVIALQRNRA